ncbi:class I SAM-dependent methyltransferase [Candidatus Falkowbacteria bacterium]|nr:class I SAM-dependent methyltransferase [Candidatus Falkowbacteria bacterium]
MNKQKESELLDLVRQNYENIADDFDQTRQRKLWPTLAAIASKTPTGAKVLDVGCGNGRLRQAWLGRNVEYVGIEPSNNLLFLAKNNASWQLPGQKLLSGDIIDLNRLDLGLFDEVFCIAVIHHLPGKDMRRQALRLLLEQVKPGGRVVISAWSMWQAPLFRKLVVKNFLLKLLGLNGLDFGDVVFNGFNQKCPRYYHAYTERGFRKAMIIENAEIEEFISDKKNYYAVLRKK